MSDYRRARIAGGTYFFTLVTFARRPLLTTPLARDCLRDALRETRIHRPFRLDAICLLPGHLHCLLTLPDGDSDYSERWNRIKGLFGKRYRARCESLAVPGSSRRRKGEPCSDSGASGSTASATKTISGGTSITSISIR